MTDRGPTVINTGSGNGGWALALVLLVFLGIGAFFVFGNTSIFGGKDIDVDVNLPKVEAPAVPTN